MRNNVKDNTQVNIHVTMHEPVAHRHRFFPVHSGMTSAACFREPSGRFADVFNQFHDGQLQFFVTQKLLVTQVAVNPMIFWQNSLISPR